MQDFITLGTAPVDEPCTQLGQDDYEVVCLFDADDEAAAHFAYRCEDELSATWEG